MIPTKILIILINLIIFFKLKSVTFAQSSPTPIDIFGTVAPPITNFPSGTAGLLALLNIIIRIFFVIAGILAFLNVLVAGFMFMMAGGDSKKIGQAWNKIWLSGVGLAVMVGAFLLAIIFGYILFGNPMAILQPSLVIIEPGP